MSSTNQQLHLLKTAQPLVAPDGGAENIRM
jgi:hypothetical protein